MTTLHDLTVAPSRHKQAAAVIICRRSTLPFLWLTGAFCLYFRIFTTHIHVVSFNSSSQLFLMSMLSSPYRTVFCSICHSLLSSQLSSYLKVLSAVTLPTGTLITAVAPAVYSFCRPSCHRLHTCYWKNTKIWAPSHRLSSQFHIFTFGLLSSFMLSATVIPANIVDCSFAAVIA